MNTRLAFEWLISQFDVERLGWVLIHSLWQFTLVALLAGTTVRALRGKSSVLRYGVLVVAMAVSVAAPGATWLLSPDGMPSPVAARVAVAPEDRASDAADAEADSFPMESDTAFMEIPFPGDDLGIPKTRAIALLPTRTTDQLKASWSERARLALRPWLAWIVVVWSLGVVVCSARPLLGWHMLRRLRRVGVSPVPDDVLAAMARVSTQLGLPDAVRLLQSSLARIPIVVGYLRPVILLPVRLVTSIPTAQLEAILAHELAHVRRHDFVVNLAQTVVETLFFYHPAVWWLSHQIRVEREHCCDDFVVNLLGNRVEYGRALVAIEQLRGRSSALALSAGGGSLLSRIRRLASGPVEESRRAAWCGSFVALLVCSFGCTMLVSSTLDALVSADCCRVVLPDGSTVELLGVTSDGTDPARWWRANGKPLDAQPLTGHRTISQLDWGERRRFAVRSIGAERVAWFFPGDGRYQSSASESGSPDYLREAVLAPLALPSLDPLTVMCGVGDGNFGPWATVGPDGGRESVPDVSAELAPYYERLAPIRVKSDSRNIALILPPYNFETDRYIADREWVMIAKDGRRLPAARSDYTSGPVQITFSLPPNGIDHFEFRLRPYRHWVTFENVSLRRGEVTEVKVTTAPPPSPRPGPKSDSAISDERQSKETPVVDDAQVEPAAVRKPGVPAFVLPDHLNVMAVGFDPESQDLVTVATEKDVSVRVWDLAEKKLKREVKLDTDKHGNFFLQGQLTLSGDRQRLIAILDGKATIWDTTTGKLVKTLALPQEMQNGLLRGLTATPDLSLVACGQTPGISGFDIADAYAIVWEAAAGRVLRTMTHANALQIQSIALSPDGKFLATGGQQTGMCLWDVGTGNLLHRFPNDNPGRKHPDPEVSESGANQVLCLRFSPDSQQLALGDMLSVKMVDVKTGTLLFQCDAPFRYGRSGLVFSEDGQLLARVATDKIVPIWSARTGKLLVELPTEAHDGAFSDDSRLFAVGFTDQKQALAVWQLSGDVAKAEAKSANTSQSGDWGPATNGLRARVVPVLSSMSEEAIDPAERVTKFAKAADVAFVVELENVSDKPIKLVDLWHDARTGKPIQGADWLSQLVWSVVLFDRDGKLIEQADIEVGDPEFALHEAQVATLQPGKTQQFLIKTNRWLPSFKPQIQAGSYRVAVRYRWPSGQHAARISAANPQRSLQDAAAVDVVSAAVAIEVGGESPKADLVWGKAIDGLRAAVSCEPSEATHTHGEKLVVHLHLQNVGAQPLKLVSALSLPDASATIKNDMGRRLALDESGGGLSPRLLGLLTLRPQQIVVLDAGDLALATSEEQANQLDKGSMRKLIAPAGKYSMQLKISFDNVLTQRVFVQGQEIIRVKDAWVGELDTGAAPLIIATAGTPELD